MPEAGFRGAVSVRSPLYNVCIMTECDQYEVVRRAEEAEALKIVAVDPDPKELLLLADGIRMSGGNVSVESFGDPLAAVKFIYSNHVDAVYTVSRMNRMNGLQLASLLHSRFPDMLFSFVVDGTADCTAELRALADGFIFRPVSRRSRALAAPGKSDKPGKSPPGKLPVKRKIFG